MAGRLISHKKETIEEKNEAIERAFYKIGMAMERYAKEELSKPKAHKTGESPRPNVDTGRLRNSITWATNEQHDSGSSPAETKDYTPHTTPDKGELYIGTNVEYAEYIEMGTSTMGPFPFLKPAVTNHLDEYKQMMEAELKS